MYILGRWYSEHPALYADIVIRRAHTFRMRSRTIHYPNVKMYDQYVRSRLMYVVRSFKLWQAYDTGSTENSVICIIFPKYQSDIVFIPK